MTSKWRRIDTTFLRHFDVDTTSVSPWLCRHFYEKGMHGWITCTFTSFSAVFQPYQDNGCDIERPALNQLGYWGCYRKDRVKKVFSYLDQYLFQWGLLLKCRICAVWEQILSFKSSRLRVERHILPDQDPVNRSIVILKSRSLSRICLVL